MLRRRRQRFDTILYQRAPQCARNERAGVVSVEHLPGGNGTTSVILNAMEGLRLHRKRGGMAFARTSATKNLSDTHIAESADRE